MKVFLDTSSLVKLYHREVDTVIIENVFKDFDIKAVYLSELSKIEFISTIWKKVRIQQIDEPDAKEMTNLFDTISPRYTFISTKNIIEQARNLIVLYGIQGLRTLDSLQLSTAVYLKNDVDLFITSDKLLNFFFEKESLPTLK